MIHSILHFYEHHSIVYIPLTLGLVTSLGITIYEFLTQRTTK